MKLITKIIAVLMLVFVGCSKAPVTNVISGYYKYDIVCVNQNLDGAINLKTWGSGTTIENAVLNARRKAVEDIMFKGIKKGKCNIDPLISNSNIKQQRKDFFDKFYAEKGNFNNFITEPTKDWYRSLEENKVVFSVNKSYELLVTVDVVALKEYLSQNKIM